MAMIQKVVFLEVNKGNKHGHYGKGANARFFHFALNRALCVQSCMKAQCPSA